jgi:rhodanese-related sulfurtransferase
MRISTIGFVIIAITSLVIAMVTYYTFYSPLWISASEAKKRLADGTFTRVLDVRTDTEYNLGHYPEAVHIPTQKLDEELERKLPNKQAGILIYCNTGQRSRYAADLLKAKGYKNVRYISGPYWSLLR